MNIGIRLHDTAPGTLRERLGFARDQGFSCAHIALSKVLPDFDMADAPKKLTPELAEKVRADLADSGMECAVLGCYLSLTTPDEEALRKTQEIYKAHLRFSRLMGAGVVGTETPASPDSGLDWAACQSEEAFRMIVRNLAPLVRCAEEEDAYLAVEPVFSHIISTPERAERMLEALKSDHVRIILDTVNLLSWSNADRVEDIVEESIRRLGDRISVLHMKDYTLDAQNQKVLSTACGQGIMDYGRLLSFAGEKGIPMTLEDTCPENARQARKYLENAVKTL